MPVPPHSPVPTGEDTEHPATGADPSYARRFADRYDSWFTREALTEDTVGFLASRAGAGGRTLELGVGTGRIALRLVGRGIRVDGIDASPRMAAQLAAKAGGDRVAVTIGDFTRLPPARVPYDLVYAAAGTLFELPSQEAQSSCFRSVAGLVGDAGAFVLDAIVPEVLIGPAWSDGHEVPTPGSDRVTLHRRFEPARQRYHSHYTITLGGADGGAGNGGNGRKDDRGRTEHVHIVFRYAGAGELDLMAQQAGLELRERYGSWAGDPFSDDSPYHVSVYRPAR
ncbi:class I SAM-dependent DNA methyltransferase [Streptomyces sp. NPDC127106]|uniref:class I SAM-dependent DNA methyltransferase n=1 Tax=Streptomyces sp. NPDC127106 TaxID=3345360 RepID=UPI003641B566